MEGKYIFSGDVSGDQEELPLEFPVHIDPNQEEFPFEVASYEERLAVCDEAHDLLIAGKFSDQEFQELTAELLPELYINS